MAGEYTPLLSDSKAASRCSLHLAVARAGLQAVPRDFRTYFIPENMYEFRAVLL